MGNSLNTAGRRVESLLNSTSKKLSSVIITGTLTPLALNLAPRATATDEEEGFECPICFLVRILLIVHLFYSLILFLVFDFRTTEQ